MNSALKTALELFQWANKETSSKSELEVYYNQGHGRSVVWSEKKCEDLQESQGSGAGFRVILKSNSDRGKQGFAFTTSLDKSSVQRAVRSALDSARMLEKDPYRILPKPKNINITTKGLFDDTVFSASLSSIKEKLREGESKILKKNPLIKSILRAGYSESSGELAIVNSNGIEASYASTYSGLGVSCLAEKNTERQEGGYGVSKIYNEDLNWDQIFESAKERTIQLLGGQTISSGKIPVIFDPSVACEFLSLVSGMICAESVQKGKSPFKGRLGEKVASKILNITDNGLLERGLATSPFDDEGVPTQKTNVISSGTLKNFLYDTYTAQKDKTQSTGNASRGGFKSAPVSGTSNFYIESGSTPREKILKETTGLYLYDVMGLHMADPISGDFSVGVMGAWIENGEFKHGVRGNTLSGNLLEMLKNISVLGNDLTFFGSTGSPTFRVEDMTIGGN